MSRESGKEKYFLKYINPGFLFRNRQWISIYIRNYTQDGLRVVRGRMHQARVFLAEHGLGLPGNDRRFAALKNRHWGRRAFVIGNGSSLRLADLERLQNEITFASNRIYVCFNETNWRPSYYGTSYPDDGHGFYADIDNMQCGAKFLPLAVRRHGWSMRSAIYYRFVHRVFYPGQPLFSENALDGIYWGGTVTYILLQLAFYMGIREVYLLGVDADYQFKDERLHAGWDVRKYTTDSDPDHFHKDYLKPGREVGLTCLHLHLAAYHSALAAYKKAGGVIYNASRGGKLDLFPRVNFDDLFNATPAVGAVCRSP